MALKFNRVFTWKFKGCELPSIKISEEILLSANEFELEISGRYFFFEREGQHWKPTQGDSLLLENGLIKSQLYDIDSLRKLIDLSTCIVVLSEDNRDLHESYDSCDEITVAGYIDWTTTLEELQKRGQIKLQQSECYTPVINYCFSNGDEMLEADCLMNPMFNEVRDTLVMKYRNLL